jgi:phage gp29-like protein
VLSGFRVHEAVWGIREGALVPMELLDRPNRRFVFNQENDLRLLTKAQPTKGEEVLPHEFILSRHMPSQTNPYGRAVLSACFWPYTFKKGGIKFFYQFCERYGLPFPIGKYPRGAEIKDQQALLDALLQLLSDGAAAIPDDATVELLTSSHSGQLAQEALVNLCNREMSKALTSQTLATELQGGGSFAAAKTHSERQADTSHANRKAVSATFNTLFTLITEFNVGMDVVAPVFEFFKESEPTKDRAEQYEIVARLSGRVPLAALHEEMNIPVAADGEEVLQVARPPVAPVPPVNEFSYGCPHCLSHEFTESEEEELLNHAAIDAADSAIEEHLISPIEQMLKEYEEQGKTLREFYADIEKLGIRMDQNKLAEVNAEVMALAFARGMGEQS